MNREPQRFAARRAIELAIVSFALWAWFSFIATRRIVDDDEAFYWIAASLVRNGALPYVDFFFPQMPLTPYLYAAGQVLFGASMESGRLVAVSAATASGVLVFYGIRRNLCFGMAVLGTALFATHWLCIDWLVTSKTHSLSVMTALAAMLFAERDDRPSAVAAGVIAGLCFAGRALMLPVVVGVLIHLWADGDRRRLRSAGVGFFVACIPVIALYAMDPAAFWFDNFGYHAVRADGEGYVKDVPQKLAQLASVFLSPLWSSPGGGLAESTGLQTTPVVIMAALAWRRCPSHPWAWLSFLLIAFAVLPSPTYSQYFVVVVGPLVIASMRCLGEWTCRGLRYPGLLLGLGCLAVVPSFRARVMDTSELRRSAHADKVARAVRDVTPQGHAVAAHWPAFLVASEREILAPAHNQFVRVAAARVAPSRHAALKLFSEGDLKAMLLRGEATTFVVGQYIVIDTALALKRSGWQRQVAPVGVSVWTRP